MKKRRILIVDDDHAYLTILRNALEGMYEVECASGRDEFVTIYRPYSYDLILLDMRLECAREGLDLAKTILEQDPLQPIIVMTAYADTESHIEAIRAGALAYLNKADFSPIFVAQMVEAVLRQGALQRRVASLERQLTQLEPGDIIGTTPEIEQVRWQIKQAAGDSNVTVLVRGESGTGKELVARALHRWSDHRKDGPFIAVSIAGLHTQTIHSDLFGHEKGSFTGANAKRKGFIEEAHQGILFLDEIGDLDAESQVKLLRVLETRSFSRLGGNRNIDVDIQVVTATHHDLEKLINTGHFRSDLYYRLRAFEIMVPALRDRVDDIPLLAQHFLNGMAIAGRTAAKAFQRDVLRAFRVWPWPGNVRELRNVVEFAAIQCRATGDSIITIAHLPKEFKAEKTEKKEAVLFGDYQAYLARAELDLIEQTLLHHQQAKKTDLAAILKYNDRFTFARRVRRVLEKYPHLADEFTQVARLFSGVP